jgi:hypothetical protein
MEIDDIIEEIKDALVESSFTSRWSLIEGYHIVGKLLNEKRGELSNYYGSKFVNTVADKVGKGERTIRYCMQFAEKYPDLDLLPEGKDVSWNKIIRKLENREIKKKVHTCPKCGFQW